MSQPPVSRRVAVFAATRADLFPLGPVVQALAQQSDLEVTLLASGTIGNADFGDPLAGVDLTGVTVEPVAGGLGSSDYRSLTEGGARISAAMADVLDRVRPDACVVLGDRWELLYAVPPVLLLGVPLVHLHGGELTEGAVDDRIRHATTKLADLHCVSTERAAERLRAMGEPADRVFVTGAPSLDRVAGVVPATDERLSELLGRTLTRPFALVTYHPATAADEDPGTGARDTLAAVAATVGSALLTHPGLDQGREAVLAAIDRAAHDAPHLVPVTSLGPDYLAVLAAADVVVGNSSSGVLEAASFGVPVVDVGDRQRGRERSANVIHAAPERGAIESAIRTCLAPEFRAQARTAVNPYGDGRAAARIVDVIRLAVQGGHARKPFVDVEAGAAS
jgi:UDP-N-acetylglucosamine 2-epimerase (non-hydrolysing)